MLYPDADTNKLYRFDSVRGWFAQMATLRDSLLDNALESLRVQEPVIVSPEQPVSAAIELMQREGSGCVVVTTFGRPVGVFTERDVITKILGESMATKNPISDVMSSPPVVVREDWSVARVIRAMHEGGFRHMPVVDHAGFLQGVVSAKRVVEYLVEYFPSTVFNLPPDPEQIQVAREGA